MKRMKRRAVPAWGRPGARWVPWFYWPLLCLSIADLVYRIVDGQKAGQTIGFAFVPAAFVFILISNRRHRQRQSGSQGHPPV